MNESLAESIIMKWAHELEEADRPRLMPLANLASIVARHLPDPQEDILASLLPARLRPIGKAIHVPVTRKKSGPQPKATQGTCSWKGCTKPRFCRGLCCIHYNRKCQGKPMDAPIRRSPGSFARGIKTRKAKADSKAAAKDDRHAEVAYDIPTEIKRWIPNESADKEQRTSCRAHNRCSIMAKRYRWERWGCSACRGPRPEESS